MMANDLMVSSQEPAVSGQQIKNVGWGFYAPPNTSRGLFADPDWP